MHHTINFCTKIWIWFKVNFQPVKRQNKHRHHNCWMYMSRDIFGRGGGQGLNFTRFADSRKGGGNAMGKGGGSREREWGILTVTYRQRAEQSRADRALWTVYHPAIPHPAIETWMWVNIPAMMLWYKLLLHPFVIWFKANMCGVYQIKYFAQTAVHTDHFCVILTFASVNHQKFQTF